MPWRSRCSLSTSARTTARARASQREARAAAGLSSHPNVVTIYDVGEHDGRAFIVMELMRGGSLADVLRRGRRDRARARAALAARGRLGLDAAHAAGIVHRDVKPANLLLDDRDRLAIADFGIARLAWEEQVTQTGQVLGTAAYLSPEQAMGEPATAASDRYALAVVAFELLTGRSPSTPSTSPPRPARTSRTTRRAPPSSTPDLTERVDAVSTAAWPRSPTIAGSPAAEFVERARRVAGRPPPRRTGRARRAHAPPATAPGRDRTPPPPGRPVRAAAAADRAGHSGPGAGVLIAGIAAAAARRRPGYRCWRRRWRRRQGANRAAKRRRPRRRRRRPPRRPPPSRPPRPPPRRPPPPPPRATPKPATARGTAGGQHPSQLQLQAFSLNKAGKSEEALPVAQRRQARLQGQRVVSPCGYALFELARAHRGTGDARGGQRAREAPQRYPGDQRAAVEAELEKAKADAGE